MSNEDKLAIKQAIMEALEEFFYKKPNVTQQAIPVDVVGKHFTPDENPDPKRIF